MFKHKLSWFKWDFCSILYFLYCAKNIIKKIRYQQSENDLRLFWHIFSVVFTLQSARVLELVKSSDSLAVDNGVDVETKKITERIRVSSLMSYIFQLKFNIKMIFIKINVLYK